MANPISNRGGSGGSPGLALGVAIATFVCCNLIGGALGIVFAAIAMSKGPGPQQDRFVTFSWISTAGGLLLSIVGILIIYSGGGV